MFEHGYVKKPDIFTGRSNHQNKPESVIWTRRVRARCVKHEEITNVFKLSHKLISGSTPISKRQVVPVSELDINIFHNNSKLARILYN